MKKIWKRFKFHIYCMIAWYMWWVVVHPLRWSAWKLEDLWGWLDATLVRPIEDHLEETMEQGDQVPVAGELAPLNYLATTDKCQCPGCSECKR